MKVRRASKYHLAILLPHLAGGGAERVGVNLANALLNRGYSIDMVLLSATGAFLSELDTGVQVVDLQVERMRWLLPKLVRYLRQSRPTTLLACMWPLTVIAILARIFARVSTRVVAAEHTTWSRDERASSLWGRLKVRLTMRWIFPFADDVVAVSMGAADDLAKFSGFHRGAISMIYNPVVSNSTKASQIFSNEPALWWSGPHKRVLSVGVLKPIKDYGTLLDAFALLRQRLNARLLILGEGLCRHELQERIKNLGLEDCVFMPGFSKDTFAYYEHADLHVLSSTGEGLPTVIIEALAAGTPVVSTDCPSGPREILRDGQFGRLVPVGDAVALAAAMEESLTSVHDSAGLKARAQDFSIDKAVDQYLDLLIPDQDRSKLSGLNQ